jgi:hypothetical protein
VVPWRRGGSRPTARTGAASRHVTQAGAASAQRPGSGGAGNGCPGVQVLVARGPAAVRPSSGGAGEPGARSARLPAAHGLSMGTAVRAAMARVPQAASAVPGSWPRRLWHDAPREWHGRGGACTAPAAQRPLASLARARAAPRHGAGGTAASANERWHAASRCHVGPALARQERAPRRRGIRPWRARPQQCEPVHSPVWSHIPWPGASGLAQVHLLQPRHRSDIAQSRQSDHGGASVVLALPRRSGTVRPRRAASDRRDGRVSPGTRERSGRADRACVPRPALPPAATAQALRPQRRCPGLYRAGAQPNMTQPRAGGRSATTC